MIASALKAVAWDIDGTLIDSEPLHLAALIAVSKRYGIDLTREPAERFLGVHMGDVWRSLCEEYPEDLTEAAWHGEIVDWYMANADQLVPMPGAIDTVRALHDKGIVQICVSNSARGVVDTNIARLGIAPCLAGSISFSDVVRGKPDPEPYARAVQILGVPAGNILAVEDSPTGAMSARRARLCVAFYKPHPDAPESFDGADIEISALSEIPALQAFTGA
ncbi:HAD superfamily hydrolase (TIGR01509 family) [Breoghania corrubedonensis]|uniref:HAD superfamily hydrolase (TIGR01509 family) n=1 Tax=Breoghania corrubedonensis TaxID=665038 RepID=A0A2T5V912_9HYPH|nr:HAD family phosphatase [Breoghania corrubedonensis]PTW60230.1 HAD superfamily hydrolase (TIGR01509 family) [Breoghania corrubedonensis]